MYLVLPAFPWYLWLAVNMCLNPDFVCWFLDFIAFVFELLLRLISEKSKSFFHATSKIHIWMLCAKQLPLKVVQQMQHATIKYVVSFYNSKVRTLIFTIKSQLKTIKSQFIIIYNNSDRIGLKCLMYREYFYCQLQN